MSNTDMGESFAECVSVQPDNERVCVEDGSNGLFPHF